LVLLWCYVQFDEQARLEDDADGLVGPGGRVEVDAVARPVVDGVTVRVGDGGRAAVLLDVLRLDAGVS
jgi:hypothetical protein